MAEHVFLPDEPPKPFRIEYDGILYDGGDWDTYPVRQGWHSEPWIAKFHQGKIPEEYHPAIRSWLYFGVLHYVFGDELDQADFLLTEEEEGDGEEDADADAEEQGSQRQYLTTRHLEKYTGDAKKWKKNGYAERAVEIVTKVCGQLPRYTPYLSAQMGFGIQLICHSLWYVASKRGGPEDKPAHVRNWMFVRPNLAEYMVQNGWCPLDAEKCRQAGSEVDTAAYLLQLVRTKAAWNKRDHAQCRKTECIADNVDESVYFTRHVEEDCSCEHVTADIPALGEILEDGGIPLVEITPPEEEGGEYTIRVVKRKTSTRYASISHVWADGLGNPHTNSLPNCQLGLLYERARMLLTDKEYVPKYENGPYGPLHTGAARLAHAFGSSRRGDSVLVWIDTLCIPHAREVRGLAIQRIRDTYLNAYRTMIIDSEIKQVESSAASSLELCLRVIYCSGWIRRLWTLQEGLAAKSRLYVLLADKAVNVSTIADELLTKSQKGKVPLLQERIVYLAVGTWYSYFQHTIDYASKFERFVTFVASPFVSGEDLSQELLISWNWFNVATRASSKDGDRPIVLAGVLNLDVGEILKVKGSDERMRKLYSMLDGFPSPVLFQAGPRFEEDGMRWAVKVCRFTDEVQYLGSGPGVITPRGLHVKDLRSWTFATPRILDLRRWIGADDRQYWHDWNDLPIAEGIPDKMLLLKTREPVDINPDELHGILLHESRASRAGELHDCALVSLQTTEDDVHYARYLSVGTIRAFDFARSDFPKEGFLIWGLWDDLQKPEWVVG
ncbi:hypothetical protein BJY00DRAFT_292882 [Aspergillus carlsbadensis]|nr:hypothetical protein BJY00DRAFT_292882 [Aspergillus carlsbadensis]